MVGGLSVTQEVFPQNFLFLPTFLSSRILATILHYPLSASSYCLTLTISMREEHCAIHTPWMGSPFPIVHAEWFLVFWSFKIMLCCVEKDYFKLNSNHFSFNNILPTMKRNYLMIPNQWLSQTVTQMRRNG